MQKKSKIKKIPQNLNKSRWKFLTKLSKFFLTHPQNPIRRVNEQANISRCIFLANNRAQFSIHAHLIINFTFNCTFASNATQYPQLNVDERAINDWLIQNYREIAHKFYGCVWMTTWRSPPSVANAWTSTCLLVD